MPGISGSSFSSPICPPPEGTVHGSDRRQVSWLRVSAHPLDLPGDLHSSGDTEECPPLTVAGAAAGSGSSLTAFPSCVPPHAGAVGGSTIALAYRIARARTISPGPVARWASKPLSRIDKCPAKGLMCLIDGRSFRANRERGTEHVQIRGCPRNCKRRAQSNSNGHPSHCHWANPPGKAANGQNPRSQETYRRSTRLPGGVPRQRLVPWPGPVSLGRSAPRSRQPLSFRKGLQERP